MDLVVAGGVQNMSMIPISSAMTAGQALGFDDPFTGSTGWTARYGSDEVSQFTGAEMMASKWDITREQMEEFAVESHLRAIRARAEGRFDAEIEPLNGLTFDEGPPRAELGQDPLAADAHPPTVVSPPPAPARSATRRPRCSSPTRTQ